MFRSNAEHQCLNSLPEKQQAQAESAQNSLKRVEPDLKRGDLAAASKDLRLAIKLLGSLVEAQPEHWEFYDALNYAKEQQWELTLPMEQRKAIKRAKDQLELDQWKEAKDILEKLIEAKQPDQPKPPVRWVLYDALAYAELKGADAGTDAGKYQQALKSYEEAIELMQKEANSDNAGVEKTCGASHMLSNKGYIHLKLNENREAVQAYEQAAPISHIDPQRTVAYFNLCVAYYYAGDWQKAIGACTQATHENSRNADAYLVKGKALVKNKWPHPLEGEDRDQAKEAMARYVCLAPKGVHFDEAAKWLDYLHAANPPTCDPAPNPPGTNLCQ
jgi:tetratricopeptide (TPR) repeat protein